jgi:small subunit ribosomal protein S16
VAVKIRLKRMGKVRAPHYRIVVVDSRKKRDGRVLEEIGKYHPKEEPSFIDVVSDRAQYWLGVGAQPSEAVAKILKITGDWQTFKGLKGTEGTQRFAEPKPNKQDIFNEALKDVANEPKGEAVTRKASKKAAEKSAAKPAEKTAEKPAAEAAPDAAPEAKADAPAAEAPVEAPAEEAVVEVPVAEEAAPVPADETPEGAADVAETAETAEVNADAKTEA